MTSRDASAAEPRAAPLVLDRRGDLSGDAWEACQDESQAREGGQRLLLRPPLWRAWAEAGAQGSAALWVWPDEPAPDSPDEGWEALVESGQPCAVALHFPALADGRAFSLAQVLRRQRKFKGDLLATGPFLPDQASFLFRCGFDLLQFDQPDRARTAAGLLRDFTATYQAELGTRTP